jgi:hypothetical protein
MIMGRHEWPHIALPIPLLRGLYLAIIMGRHEGPHSALTIALLRRLYFATMPKWVRANNPAVTHYHAAKNSSYH